MASVNKCISCGATLEGGGKSGKVTCPYCGTVNKVEKEPARKDVIVCAVCSSENELDAQHCSQCGADLYFTCPKCRTLNTADAVHCKKCGANLSAEIKKFKHALEAKRAAAQIRKKRLSSVLKIIGVIALAFAAFFTFTEIQQEKKQAEYRLKATQTVQSWIQAVAQADYPFRWVSKDNGLTISVLPEIRVFGDSFHIYLYVTNKTKQDCHGAYTFYAQDDNKQRYEPRYSAYLLTTMPGQSIMDDVALKPALSVNSAELTVHIDKLCGYEDIDVPLNLQSSLLYVYRY